MKTKLDIKELKKQAQKLAKAGARHASFAGIVLILIAYLFVVWQISQLATAEPSADQTASSETSIPKIDKNAISQIEALEQSNTQVKALFDQARNNPFQE